MASAKLPNYVKVAALFVWAVYFLVFNSPWYSVLPAGRGLNELNLKLFLPRESCVAVMGGSNALQGISAVSIAWEGCTAVNYGVSGEGGSFEIYFKSLVSHLSFDSAIYSPIEFWAEDAPVEQDESLLTPLFIAPGISILSQLKAAVISALGRDVMHSPTGDQNEFFCAKRFPTRVINLENFKKNHGKVVAEISERLKRIDGISNNATVLARIPPIYVRRQDLDLYRAAIDVRKHMLQAAGWTVLDTTTVSSDVGLFCDSGHPNARGRDFFSQELKSQLSQIRRVQQRQ